MSTHKKKNKSLERGFIEALNSGALGSTHYHFTEESKKSVSSPLSSPLAVSGLVMAAVFGGTSVGIWYSDKVISSEFQKASIKYEADYGRKYEAVSVRIDEIETVVKSQDIEIRKVQTQLSKSKESP